MSATWNVLTGDCREAMAGMEAGSVDAVVCDPPYGLEFMGKEWDRLGDVGRTSHQGIADEPGFKGFRLPAYNGSSNAKCATCHKWRWDHAGRKCECSDPQFANVKAHQARLMQDWHEAWAREALRVLKPGGHLLAFGGTRTYHRLAAGIEDAGFEIRDTIAWMYGSGFPKSLDVGKAIDKAAGAEREVVGVRVFPDGTTARATAGDAGVPGSGAAGQAVLTAAATTEAAEWEGWGTALKPAYEPVVVARKPLAGTVAGNVLAHGTGALNVDGCRVEFGSDADKASAFPGGRVTSHGSLAGPGAAQDTARTEVEAVQHGGGRWPANVVLDEEAGAMLDEQTGDLHSQDPKTRARGTATFGSRDVGTGGGVGDRGGASRFFYCAKAGAEERHRGLTDSGASLFSDPDAPDRNDHPTVKPIALMRWLCRLVTPPGGLVLDPFTGSGTTGIAATAEGFRFIGVEQDERYARIARARIAEWSTMERAA